MKKPTEKQIERVKAANEEAAKKRDAMLSQFPVVTAWEIVEVARERAWDILAEAKEFDDAGNIDPAAINATAHTLATVMVALRAAGITDPVE